MTYLHLGLLFGLGAIFLLAAIFPRRTARSRRSPDPFVGFEHEWHQIMKVRSKPARVACVSDQGNGAFSPSPEVRAA